MIQQTSAHHLKSNECFKGNVNFTRPELSSKETQKQNLDRFQKYLQLTNTFAHHHLFCRDSTEMLTVSQSKILQSQRQKYLHFVSKNYKYKIPQQFMSKKAMKDKKTTLNVRIKAEKAKKQAQMSNKPSRRPRAPKQGSQGKGDQKKVKTNKSEVTKTKKIEKTKIKKDGKKQQQQADHEQGHAQDKGEQDNQPIVQDNFESEDNLKNEDLDAIEDDYRDQF